LAAIFSDKIRLNFKIYRDSKMLNWYEWINKSTKGKEDHAETQKIRLELLSV